jgi:D-3-phosphoglycerate dehydrogenase
MKQGKWEKKKFLGEEVREKTLGLAGLGRIGQEVARRAAGFGMRLVAHDPFVSEAVAASLGVELMSLDDVFAKADYVSLHLPRRRRPPLRQRRSPGEIAQGHPDRQHRPRRPHRRGGAGRRHRGRQVGGAGLDVFDKEPTVDQRLQMLPQVVATPHIAASTREGQELVGVETAAALRDFLRDGIIRNAVNFPSSRPRNTGGCSRSSRSARSWARSWRR